MRGLGKKKVNGHKLAAFVAPKLAAPPPANVNELAPKDESLSKIRLQGHAIAQTKQALADVQLEIMRLEMQRAQLANAIINGGQRYQGIVYETALELGIDLGDPTHAGSWMFNEQVNKFIRTSPAPTKISAQGAAA